MTCAEVKSYLEKFIPLIKNIKDDRKVVIAPPFTAISTFSYHSDFDYLDISSQNIHWEDQGAFTAEISPKMLLEHGVSYAIVGHSEPRKYFSESDEQINKRAVFAQSSGLTPIVCVGETLEQRERGEAVRVITRQVEQGLENTDPSNLIVAYEPIWAIGTGKTCEAEDANKICSLIRKLIGFDDVIIQYGGSVKPNNIDEIMSMSDIDGVLVGVVVKNKQEENPINLNLDGVFVYMSGSKPITDFLGDQIALKEDGGVIVDDFMSTNSDGVWAIGDIRNTPFKQAVVAASDGCIAAMSIDRYLNSRKNIRVDWIHS